MAANEGVNPIQNDAVIIADEKQDSHKTPASPSSSSLEAGTHASPVVDPKVEQAIFRKLDYRIVPTVMWCYLMNMMDRGMWPWPSRPLLRVLFLGVLTRVIS